MPNYTRNHSYDYNTLCDVCGFKKKASELRKRWDGFMVCEEDWEPRNILDFYKTRNDAHLLPFTRPDDSGELTWSPTTTGVVGTFTFSTSYTIDVNNVVTYKIIINPTLGFGDTTGTNPTFTLPIGTVNTDLKGTVTTSQGTLLGKPTNGATIATPNFVLTSSPRLTLTIAGQYKKA